MKAGKKGEFAWPKSLLTPVQDCVINKHRTTGYARESDSDKLCAGYAGMLLIGVTGSMQELSISFKAD